MYRNGGYGGYGAILVWVVSLRLGWKSFGHNLLMVFLFKKDSDPGVPVVSLRGVVVLFHYMACLMFIGPWVVPWCSEGRHLAVMTRGRAHVTRDVGCRLVNAEMSSVQKFFTPGGRIPMRAKVAKAIAYVQVVGWVLEPKSYG